MQNPYSIALLKRLRLCGIDPKTGKLAHPADLVNPSLACPQCGERRGDELVWDDEERVDCQTCGATYVP